MHMCISYLFTGLPVYSPTTSNLNSTQALLPT